MRQPPPIDLPKSGKAINLDASPAIVRCIANMKPTPTDVLLGLLNFHKALDRYSEDLFAPFGITSAQFNVLNVLAQNGGSLGQTEVVANLLVAKSSASVLLNRLVRDGLVARRQDKKDLRQVLIALTPKGWRAQKKVSPHYERAVQKIFGSASLLRRRQVLEALDAFRAAL